MRRLHLTNRLLRRPCECKECRFCLKVEVCIDGSILLQVGLAFRQSWLWLKYRIVQTLSVVALSSGTLISFLLSFPIYIVNFPTILLSVSISPLGLDEIFVHDDGLSSITLLLA